MKKPDERFVDLDHSRIKEQRAVMETIVVDGVCPFCPENLVRYHTREILKQTDLWMLTQNQWPYEGADVHLLFILKRHAVSLDELTADDWVELGELVSWVYQHLSLPGGLFGMRFGETKYSGATVCHLHAQLIVPKKNPATGLPVQVPMWTGTRT